MQCVHNEMLSTKKRPSISKGNLPLLFHLTTNLYDDDDVPIDWGWPRDLLFVLEDFASAEHAVHAVLSIDQSVEYTLWMDRLVLKPILSCHQWIPVDSCAYVGRFFQKNHHGIALSQIPIFLSCSEGQECGTQQDKHHRPFWKRCRDHSTTCHRHESTREHWFVACRYSNSSKSTLISTILESKEALFAKR